MASGSCKVLALFEHRFLCVKQDGLRSNGWAWYFNLGETLNGAINTEIDADDCVAFSCDLMPLSLVTFNDETTKETN